MQLDDLAHTKRNAFDAKLNLRQKNEGRYSDKVKASTRPRKFRLIRARQRPALGGIVNRRFFFLVLFVCAAGAATLVYVFQRRLASGAEFDHQLKRAKDEAELIREQVILPTEKKVPAGENFTAALRKFGLSAGEAASASAAAQHAFNLRQVRAGNTITAGRSVKGTLREIDYKIDSDRMLKIVPEDRGFTAQVKEIPSRTEVAAVTGRVDDSLFNAVEDTGESAELAMRLAQIFGYDLDFFTDPRKGDTFRIVLEKRKYANGETAGYGRILAAEYENAGRKYQALLFHDPAGRPGYYSADGKSLQKAFLRSPLKFGAPVTSHFNRARFHPILKTYRPHMGTDYGAPVGTPVQTIGSGRVVFGPQGRRRQHGADHASQRLRDNVFAFVAHVCAQRRARGNRQDHRPSWEHGTFHRAAPRFPHSAKGPVQKFRKTWPASLRSRFKEKPAGVRRRAREMASAAEKPWVTSSQRRSFQPGRNALIPAEVKFSGQYHVLRCGS